MNEYSPNYVTPPGATIYDWMEEKSISIDKMSELLDLEPLKIVGLLVGFEPINEELAEKLSNVIGCPSQFWITREEHYREEIKEGKKVIL